jgi:NADPH:quinone reductase-like Zn-dependent oxidoreductase
LVDKGKLKEGQAVFVHGCLGGVGRAAVQIAITHGAAVVAGSCRASMMDHARDLGVNPVVEFDSIPAILLESIPTIVQGHFDIVFDTVGTLSPTTARMLLKPGGRIVDIVPSAGKFLKSALPGPYRVLITRQRADYLDELAHACAQGTLRLPIAQTVPLRDAIAALTELERNNQPKGGKLVITVG